MSHINLKRWLGKLWPSRDKQRKVILLYHSVGNTSWGMPEKKFHDQMSWLYDNTKVLSLTDLIDAAPKDELQVAITFDDGYSTLYDYAAPILDTKKITPMVYLNTGWISESKLNRRKSDGDLGHYPNEQFLAWDEVMELYNSGWEFGSHGVNHYNFALTGSEITKQELLNSRNEIQSRLNMHCLHFSYPWGQYTERLKQLVSDAGYQYAVAANHANFNHKSELLALPRINISNEYSMNDFKNIMKGKWDYLGIVHKLKGL